MRATSLPAALPVAVAAIPFVVAALVPLAVPSAALAERWLRPVPGEVARSFDYLRAAPFARGAHRGVDLAAPPGTAVRAACAGRVMQAGPVAGHGGVVSIRCGGRRVSHLPLRTIATRAGATVRAGASLGTVAAGHGGLHVGVRREGDPFGYQDPLSLLPAFELPGVPVRAPRPIPVRRVPPRGPSATHALHRAPPPEPGTAPEPAPAALRPAPTAPQPAPAAQRLAPWPVWLGLALLLSGAAGSGTIVLRRRRGGASRRRPSTVQALR